MRTSLGCFIPFAIELPAVLTVCKPCSLSRNHSSTAYRYADLVEKQRLAECCAMVKHIRKGLSMVVPHAVRQPLPPRQQKKTVPEVPTQGSTHVVQFNTIPCLHFTYGVCIYEPSTSKPSPYVFLRASLLPRHTDSSPQPVRVR